MKSYQQFFAELKRRKVFRVAGIYGIVSFGVLQAADLALPRLGLPDWTVTFMLALLLLFFPVALILAWAFEVTPEGVARTEAPVPGEIESIVAEPASKRWPSGLLALLGVAALLGSGWWLGRRMSPEPAPTPGSAVLVGMGDLGEDDRAAIAVLPFADMSAGGDQEYFGDGMAEEIINTLVSIRDLRVAGRTSAFAYKGQNKDLREIGTELGVEYLVEGSVRKERDQLRITAQLIDTSDGSHLWSESYDRPLANVFQIQREIAESIADELKVPLGLGEKNLIGPTADLEAYDLYLAGRARIRERGVALREGIRLFEAVIARDSNWAPAWAGLAEATELRVWYRESQPDDVTVAEFMQSSLAEAARAAQRALELDPANASALVALGSVHRNRAEWAESEAAYLKAIALDPDNAEAHQQYGELLLNLGRAAEAVRATDRAAVLDPAPIRFGMLATALDLDGRLAEAIEANERARSINHARSTARILTRRYMQMGRWDEAVDALDRWNREHPDQDPFVGDREQIASAVAGLRDGSLTRPADLDSPATQWLMLGEPDSAVVTLLEGARSLPFGRVIELRRSVFAPIWSDPRIEAFFRERGLRTEVQQTPISERTRPLALRGTPR